MEVYAHRAGRGLAPENTLFACETALKIGVDYIDFDIGMTKDNVIVVTHDLMLNPLITRDALGRFIQEALPIRSLTFQELRAYNVGQINPKSEYATFFPQQQQLKKASIPSLKEAIEHVKSHAEKPIAFQIEIKADHVHPIRTVSNKEFSQALLKVLVEMEIVQLCEIQSFNFDYLLALQTLEPKIKTSYLTYPQALNPISSWETIPKQIKQMGGSCWGAFEMDLTQEKIKQAQQLGLKVLAWGYPEQEKTEFNETQITKLINWGIDGIITDRPDKLKAKIIAS